MSTFKEDFEKNKPKWMSVQLKLTYLSQIQLTQVSPLTLTHQPEAVEVVHIPDCYSANGSFPLQNRLLGKHMSV